MIEELEVLSNERVSKYKTFEISTEYIRFSSDSKMEIGVELDCALNLPKDYGTINFKATVSEVDDIYDNEYTAVYQTMTEAARQTLLYYMYMYTKNSD